MINATVETPQIETAAKSDKTQEAFKILGIDATTVAQLKENFGKLELAWINDKPYLYRPLFRREFRKLRDPAASQGTTDLHIEEKVTCLCVVAPKLTDDDVDRLGAGLASTIAALVYNLSDFDIDMVPVRL